MKKSLTIFLFLSLFFFFSGSMKAQDYSTPLGLRVGSANGISIKQFVGYSTAIEGLVVYRRGGLRVIGLAEQHFSLGRRSNTSVFFGLGGHYGYNYLLEGDRGPLEVYGVDFIAGLEYVFPHSDFIFAVDLKPMLELKNGTAISGNNAGVSLRYMIN